MNKTQEGLIQLLARAVGGSGPDIQLSELRIESLYDEACAHQVQTLLLEQIQTINSLCTNENSELLKKWRNQCIYTAMGMQMEVIQVAEVFREMVKSGIPVVALKGLTVRNYYPHPDLRSMGDFDILVHEKDFSTAIEILASFGYTHSKDNHTKHIVFRRTGFMTIELHRSLAEDEVLPETVLLDEDAWKNTEAFEIEGVTVQKFNPDMQLLHLIIHMAAHFISGGFGLRQLIDVVVFEKKEKGNINWDHTGRMLEKYGLAKFSTVIFRVCDILFNTDIMRKIGVNDLEDKKYIDCFIQDIFEGGSFGLRTTEREQASVLLSNGYGGDNVNHESKVGTSLRIIFPSAEALAAKYNYTYLRKYPALLPIAWLHRIIRSSLRKDKRWSEELPALVTNRVTEIASRRVELQEWLEIR